MGLVDRFRSDRRSADEPPPTRAAAELPTQPRSASAVVARSSPSGGRLTPLTAIPFSELALSVIDVETTGFSAEHDRVVELACVRIDAAGNVHDELHTLIDPGQAVDASFVHGLDETDLAGAPSFADVAPQLLAMLDGTVLVAPQRELRHGLQTRAVRASYQRSPAGPQAVCVLT